MTNRADDAGKKARREHARELARETREKEQRKKKRNRVLVQGGVILVALGIAALVTVLVVNATRPPGPGPANMASDGILFTGDGTTMTHVATAATAAGKKPASTDETKYPNTAHIVMYVDYQCPYCQQFETTNSEQIAQWVSSGIATVEIHPLAILDNASLGSKYSTRSANAMACVANFEPDKYYDVNTALYTNQPAEQTSGLTDKQLIKVVADAGADSSDVADCITAQTFKDWTAAATERALAGPLPNTKVAKVTGTPTVLVNGTQYTGSLSDAAGFSSFVDQVVAAGVGG